jgi:hypothetical protein
LRLLKKTAGIFPAHRNSHGKTAGAKTDLIFDLLTGEPIYEDLYLGTEHITHAWYLPVTCLLISTKRHLSKLGALELGVLDQFFRGSGDADPVDFPDNKKSWESSLPIFSTIIYDLINEGITFYHCGSAFSPSRPAAFHSPIGQ